MEPRFFTQAEASAWVPRLAPQVQRLRELHDERTECRAHLEDIALVYGDGAQVPGSEAFAERERYAAEFRRLSGEVSRLVEEIQESGAQVKDPGLGLVDFYAKRGDEVVFLCWRLGEERVEHWHTLTGGFLARKPIVAVDLP